MFDLLLAPAGKADRPGALRHCSKQCVPLADLADPFDRFILATAAQLELPLVTADRAIRQTNLVEVIW
jgi:PIN domain nuclease of toxin-antitoxin system